MKLKRVRRLPANLSHNSIELAVTEFIKDSHSLEVPLDPIGFLNQTIENMAYCLQFPKDNSRQFWLRVDPDGKVGAYALCHVSKDIDNKFCFVVTQAYVSRRYRGKPVVKQWWEQLREEAKRMLCSHIICISSRSVKAYLRFLGKAYHPYVTLLKEDI